MYSCQTPRNLYCHLLFCARCDDEEKKTYSVLRLKRRKKLCARLRPTFLTVTFYVIRMKWGGCVRWNKWCLSRWAFTGLYLWSYDTANNNHATSPEKPQMCKNLCNNSYDVHPGKKVDSKWSRRVEGILVTGKFWK